MYWSLGIDTSNYTTSVAAWNSSTNEVVMHKRMLPVEKGTLGLRQSDALFSHINQLGELIELTMRQVNTPISVGASNKPRDIEGSYMPCFLVGALSAQTISATNKISAYYYSHQAGHIAAVLYATDNLSLIGKSFTAFHFSGGTTESLLVSPGEKTPFDIKQLANSLDLYAGQAVDRVGAMLGLPFPSGMYLEELALKSDKTFKINPFFRDGNPSLSGLENQAKKLLERGESKENISGFCIDWIYTVVDIMTSNALKKYPDLPVIYAGGVMSNTIIRERISKKYNAFFAPPRFSSDNAVGVAVLAGLEYLKKSKNGGEKTANSNGKSVK